MTISTRMLLLIMMITFPCYIHSHHYNIRVPGIEALNHTFYIKYVFTMEGTINIHIV